MITPLVWNYNEVYHLSETGARGSESTMQTLEKLRAIFAEQERIHATFPSIERMVTSHTIRSVDRGGGRGFVIWSDLGGLSDDQIDAVIEAEKAYFTGQNQAFEWKVYREDPPVNLVDRLIAHGFEAEEWETLLVCELDTVQPRLFDGRGHRVERVTDAAGIDEVVTVEEAVWGPDERELDDWLHRLMADSSDRFRLYLVRDGEMAVGAAWMTVTPGSEFGSLWGGSVRPEYRGRGVYGALLAARAGEARRMGLRYLMIDAGSMSLPIVEAHGFVRLSESIPCVYTPPGT